MIEDFRHQTTARQRILRRLRDSELPASKYRAPTARVPGGHGRTSLSIAETDRWYGRGASYCNRAHAATRRVAATCLVKETEISDIPTNMSVDANSGRMRFDCTDFQNPRAHRAQGRIHGRLHAAQPVQATTFARRSCDPGHVAGKSWGARRPGGIGKTHSQPHGKVLRPCDVDRLLVQIAAEVATERARCSRQ